MSFNITEAEAKREFVSNFNLWIALYQEKLNKLGIAGDDNLAEILRNVVLKFEDKFSVFQEDAFYSSISGIVIVMLIEEILKIENECLNNAYQKEMEQKFFYNFIHIFFPKEWYVRYVTLCNEFSKFSISMYGEQIIDVFFAYVMNEDFTKEEIKDLLITFKAELIVLSDGQDYSKVVDEKYTKTLGAKD